ncbi:hypothetical protein SSS_06804 [Sarcoptes scabiei]|nr:hypothetical protein SSS_06804 [Sarcoptes scabiei]
MKLFDENIPIQRRFIRQTSSEENFHSTESNEDHLGNFEPYLRFKSSLPTQTIVKENDNIVLECDVSGSPNPIVYWLRNGHLVQQQPPTHRHNVGNENESNQLETESISSIVDQQTRLGLSRVRSRLFLDCITMLDSGSIYTCVAETSLQEKRSSTKISVESLKSIRSYQTILNQDDDDDREIEISANQNAIDRLSSMQSEKIYRPIERDLVDDDHHHIGSATSSLATKTSSCSPNRFYNLSPRIYLWSETSVEHLGQDGFLHCRAAGHPKPTILWFQGDHTEPIKTEESETSRYQILPTGDLLIRNSTFDDMNVYRCMAQNEFGSDSVDQIFFYPTLNE